MYPPTLLAVVLAVGTLFWGSTMGMPLEEMTLIVQALAPICALLGWAAGAE